MSMYTHTEIDFEYGPVGIPFYLMHSLVQKSSYHISIYMKTNYSPSVSLCYLFLFLHSKYGLWGSLMKMLLSHMKGHENKSLTLHM